MLWAKKTSVNAGLRRRRVRRQQRGAVDAMRATLALAANASSNWPQVLLVIEAMCCSVYRNMRPYSVTENTKFRRTTVKR